MFEDPEGEELIYRLGTAPSDGASGTQGGCDAIFALAGTWRRNLLVGSGAGQVIPADTTPGTKACDVVVRLAHVPSDTVSVSSPAMTLRIEVNSQTDSRLVRQALTGLARTLGWDAVDAVRARARAAEDTGKVDLSGLMTHLRERAQAASGATGQIHFDGQLPDASRPADTAASAAGATGFTAADSPGDGHVWTSAVRSELEFEVDGTKYDGELDTLRVGFEERDGAMRTGIAFSYSTGETEFLDDGVADFDQWGVTPYVMRAGERTEWWALAGLGFGDLDYALGTGTGRRTASSSTESRLFAAGLEHRVTGSQDGDIDVTARAEGMVSGLEADASTLYAETTAWTRGARGEIEVGMPTRSTDGFWRPYLAAGVRWDDGDDDSGTAFEYGGGLEMTTPSLALDASVRGDGGGDFERMSYALTLNFDAGHDARGLTASLSSKYGTERSDPFARNVTPGEGADVGMDVFGLRLGYGASAWSGLLTPYLETDLDAGSFAGARFGFAYTRGPASLRLRHGFRPGAATVEDEHELSLIGKIQF